MNQLPFPSTPLITQYPTMDNVLGDPPPLVTNEDLENAAIGQSISTDNLPIPDTIRGLFSFEQDEAPYLLWRMILRYRWFGGIAQMPRAQPAEGEDVCRDRPGIAILPVAGSSTRPAAKIVRMSAPYGSLAVYWDSIRKDKQPTVPFPLFNCNVPFDSYDVQLSGPTIAADDSPYWQWRAVFFFYMYQPIWLLDGMSCGASPVYEIPVGDNVVSIDQFREGLLTPDAVE